MQFSPSQEYAFISTGSPEGTHDLGTYKDLGTKVPFTEALRKFKMYTRDLVIVTADWPFTVDLPISARRHNSRRLSLVISRSHLAPTNLISSLLESLQQYSCKHEKADSIHHQEIEAVQEHAGKTQPRCPHEKPIGTWNDFASLLNFTIGMKSKVDWTTPIIITHRIFSHG